MTHFTALRQVDAPTRTSLILQGRLRHRAYSYSLEQPHAGSRYLRVQGQLPEVGEVTGLLDVASWATATFPHLEGIDWHTVDARLLQGLLTEGPLHVSLPDAKGVFEPLASVDLLDGAAYSDALPCLHTERGKVLCEGVLPPVSGDAMDTLSALPLPLTAALGRSTLPYRTLASIQLGDVVMIEHVECRMMSRGVALFVYGFHEENLMLMEKFEEVAEYVDQDENEAPPQTTLIPTVAPLILNQVPVELSFVLMEKTVTLAQLQSMTLGEILELPMDAQQNMEIRVNHACFARGELVQLEDGRLGVEIQHLLRQE